ncbi:MAG: polysaccharide deacetylase family protein [Burkholderiales bacterium]
METPAARNQYSVSGRAALLLRSRFVILILIYAAATCAAVGTFGFSALTVGIPAVLFLALIADGIARPGSSVFYPTVSHGARNMRRVALSFDDGPDPEVTAAVLDALTHHSARATFFVIGQALEAHPQLARRMVAEGHELGNHSWRHSRWQNFFWVGKQAQEIDRCALAIAAVTGSRAQPLYRPPLGIKSPPLAWAATQHGLTVVAWSLRSHDTSITDPARIAQHVLKKIRAGDIVLLHDGHDLPELHRPVCAQALPLILHGLREQGLRCVTVSELLHRQT